MKTQLLLNVYDFLVRDIHAGRPFSATAYLQI